MNILSGQILQFLSALRLPSKPGGGIEVLNPYQESSTWSLCKQFYNKYYSDKGERILILGINPGRFGGGITGIPFTDPIRLEKDCGIPNMLKKKPELSSDFIYQIIEAFGGPEKFYRRFYISAVSPLGFIRGGKNINYYDDAALEKRLRPFIVEVLRKQLGFGLRTDICFCLGEGKNFKYLSELNDQYHCFDKIIPLAHPRFVMQYKRKKLRNYIDNYISHLGLENRS